MTPKAADSRYAAFARAQSVVRPFEILVRMPAERRALLARVLGCRIDPTAAPENQAWRIINKNLVGLQARSHRLPEQLSPFARNSTWWEIVTRCARAGGLRFDPGLCEEAIERLLFERCAAAYVSRGPERGDDVIAALPVRHPQIDAAMRALRLSADGTRAFSLALLRSLGGIESDLRESMNRLADRLRPALGWWWVTSISTGLGFLQQVLTSVFDQWIRGGLLGGRRRPLDRVAAAVVLIHMQDLVDRTLAEFELAGI
jgi:hypothetical protein